MSVKIVRKSDKKESFKVIEELLDSREKKCHTIIHTAATAAGGVGLSPIPFSDTIPITAAQIGMVMSIGKVFDISLDESTVKALIAGLATSTVGKTVFRQLLVFVPVIGNALKSITAVSLTEAIGWAAVKHFENLENEKSSSHKEGFDSGMNAAEEAMKEKIKPFFDSFKENDCFTMSFLLSSFYLINNTKLAILQESVLTTDTRNRLEAEFSNITQENSFEYLKKYLVKLNNEDLLKIKGFLERIDELKDEQSSFSKLLGIAKTSVIEEKRERIFKIIDAIPVLKNSVSSDDTKEIEEKVLSMLNNL